MKVKKHFIVSGTSNPKLSRKISKGSKTPLAKVISGRFSNGEAQVRIEEDIYGKNFYIIQSLSQPVDEHIMELCLMADALKRGGAKKLVAVVPWFGYGVQDKVFMPGEALSSKVVIDFLQSVGIHSLITVDLHSDNIIGFFEIPVVHITAMPLFAKHIVKTQGKKVLVVGPDFGSAKRARRFARDMGQRGDIGIVDKERSMTTGDVKLRGINLDVSGRVVVIPDDFISTGGTLLNVARMLHENGAKRIIACITHALLSKNSAEMIGKSYIDKLIVTDTVTIDKDKRKHLGKKLTILSVEPLISEYVKI